MNLKICKLHPDAIVPKYQTYGAACFDLHALAEDETFVHPDGAKTFRTGLAFEVPEGFAMLVFSRSGHGFKDDVRLSNCVGVVDSDYRGEVLVKLRNDKSLGEANRYFERLIVRNGDRIAQAMLVQVPRITFEVVEQLSLTERGEQGFGSTGQGGAA